MIFPKFEIEYIIFLYILHIFRFVLDNPSKITILLLFQKGTKCFEIEKSIQSTLPSSWLTFGFCQSTTTHTSSHHKTD